MADLVGSIHQFLNNCKDTIVSWCKDAAKTVCLPLSGGSMNSGANITTTGTVNVGKITVDTDNVIDGGILTLKSATPYIQINDTRLTSGTVPSSNTDTGVYFRDKDGKNIGLIYSTASRISNNTDVRTMTHMCTHDFFNPGSHGVIGVYHDATNGFWTYSPHPMKLDTNTNKFVINPADNSNRIATTGWVNEFLKQVNRDATKWVTTEVTTGTTDKPQGTVNQTCIRLKEGIQICFGIVSYAKPNYLVTFTKPFIDGCYAVTATLHYGGSSSGSGLIANKAHEDSSVHVYDTRNTSFRLGRDMYTATYNQYLNQGTEMGLGWVEWIAIGFWAKYS